MENQLQVWALKKNIRPVLLDTLAAMNMTFNMLLMHCFDFSKSKKCFQLSKSPLFSKQKSLRLQKKRLISRYGGDGWLSFALHIGLEACELHFCTMRLYCKHTFIYQKLTGSQI